DYYCQVWGSISDLLF
nr:immunoglobulin light chain junction region [Macaca mulatta]